MVKIYIEVSDAVKNLFVLWQNLHRFLQGDKMSALLSKSYIWPGPKVTMPGKGHQYEIIHL